MGFYPCATRKRTVMGKKPLVIQSLTPSVPLELRLTDAEGEHVINFRLCFDFSAFALVEAHAGINMLQPGNVFQLLGTATGKGATLLPVLLWAAIIGNSPEYEGEDGLQAVRSYVNYGNAGEIAKAVQEAFLRCLPDEQQKVLRAAIVAAEAEAEAVAE